MHNPRLDSLEDAYSAESLYRKPCITPRRTDHFPVTASAPLHVEARGPALDPTVVLDHLVCMQSDSRALLSLTPHKKIATAVNTLRATGGEKWSQKMRPDVI